MFRLIAQVLALIKLLGVVFTSWHGQRPQHSVYDRLGYLAMINPRRMREGYGTCSVINPRRMREGYVTWFVINPRRKREGSVLGLSFVRSVHRAAEISDYFYALHGEVMSMTSSTMACKLTRRFC